MARSVKQWSAFVNAHIMACESCAPYVEADGYMSSTYRKMAPVALLDQLGVPDGLSAVVLRGVSCDRCYMGVVDSTEIWACPTSEVQSNRRLNRAIARYGPRLSEFQAFLEKHPYLGPMHRTGRAILRTIETAPGVSVAGEWFRCILDRGRIPTLDQFRAPAEEQERPISEGRFNHAGQAHWYLADSPSTAIAEVLDLDGGEVWVQRFDLALCEKVLDLNRAQMALVLALTAVAMYEHVERKRAWKPGYLLPRFVMDAAKLAGFTGIRYPSVRCFDGMNLVLFDRTSPAECVGSPEKHVLPKYAWDTASMWSNMLPFPSR
jgi:RES domain-containing protein